MKACIVTPAPPRSVSGNRITALRWAKFLRGLGLEVQLRTPEEGVATPTDLLIALHAVKSHPAVVTMAQRWPKTPRIVGLAGTDLYDSRDAAQQRAAAHSLELADAIVALQPEALEALPPAQRAKVQVIVQSCPSPRPVAAREDCFEVAVVAHLRAIKDPLLCATAAAGLPASCRIAVTGIGAALSPAWAQRAAAEQDRNSRYRWLGARPRQRCLELIARSRLLVVTSRAEGGANVVSEAIACGTPVLSTRIDGSTGLLGRDYPGLFDVGDVAGLASLLRRAEADPTFLAMLTAHCRRLAPRFAPAREARAWAALLRQLVPTAPVVWPPAPS